MFCLRSWVPILFFLTAGSPLYLLIFLGVTYFLNRPCVYCSLLLAILVLAIFDFRKDWFSSPSITLPNDAANPSLLGGALSQALASAVNETVSAVVSKAADILTHDSRSRAGEVVGGWQWLQNVFSKGELRIDCMNMAIRL